LELLSELLTVKSAVPAIVIAAIAHGELLALRPFSWGNGLVARSLERVVLIGRGLDPKAVTAPEVGHHELASEYGERAAGYVGATAEGVVAWVVHCADAVRLGAREGVAMCEALQRG
jgi:Fic family protein